MNYEQQLNKILNPKGCGLQRFNDFNDTWEICTNFLTNNKIDEVRKLICSSIVEAKYCPTCKAIQKAQKETLLMCAKNELEFLEDNEEIELECETCKNKMFIDTCADRELCNKCGQARIFNKVDKIGNRIKELLTFIQEIEKIAKEQGVSL